MKTDPFSFLPRVIAIGLAAASCQASPVPVGGGASPAPTPGDKRNLPEVMVKRKTTVDDLVARIQKGLPPGWTARCSEPGGTVIVEKAVPPLLMPEGIPNPPPPDENAPEVVRVPVPLQFWFRVSVLRAPEEYRAIDARNRELQQAIKAQLEKIKALHTSEVAIPPDRFSPKTPQQEKAVAAYLALEKQLVPLPEFIYKNIVVEWDDGLAKNDIERLVDKSQTEECNQVRKAITNLLAPFELKK